MLNMPRRIILPPVYFLFSVIGMLALDRYVPGHVLFVGRLNLIGVLPMVLGVGLTLSAFFLFRRAGTEVIPFRPSQVLVTRGPYRFTRNPMYLGMLMTLSGIWLLLNSWVPSVVILLFAGIIRNRFILDEERVMRSQFGAAWDEYCNCTRRWL